MELSETQRKAIEGAKLKTVAHLNFTDLGILEQRCEKLKLTRIVRTPKENGRWGKQVETWIADADDQVEHFSLAEALICNGIT